MYGSVLISPRLVSSSYFEATQRRFLVSTFDTTFQWSDGGRGWKWSKMFWIVVFRLRRVLVSVCDSTQMNEYYLHICINNWILLRIDWCFTLRTHAHTSASVAKGYRNRLRLYAALSNIERNHLNVLKLNRVNTEHRFFFFSKCGNAVVIWIVSRWHTTKPTKRKVKMDSNVKAMKLMSTEQTAVTSWKCRNQSKIGTGPDECTLSFIESAACGQR